MTDTLRRRGRSSTVGDKVRSIISFSPQAGPAIPVKEYVEPPTEIPIIEGGKILAAKDLTKILGNQIAQMQYHREEDSSLVDLLREYLKKRMEMENAYLRDLERLNRNYQQKAKFTAPLASFTTQGGIGSGSNVSISQQAFADEKNVAANASTGNVNHATDSVEKLNFFDDSKVSKKSGSFRIFQLILHESDKFVKWRLDANVQTTSEVLDKLKDLSRDNVVRSKKLCEAYSKLQADVSNEFTEWGRTKRVYEEMYIVYVKAESKSKATLKDKAAKKLSDLKSKLDQARNSYVLQSEICSSMYNYYYTESLPQVLTYMQGEFHPMLSKLLNRQSVIDKESYNHLNESYTLIEGKLLNLTTKSVIAKFLRDHRQSFFPVGLPQLSLMAGDEPEEKLTWEISQTHPLYVLAPMKEELSEWVAKKEKETAAVASLKEAYWKNGSFGNVEQTNDAEVSAISGLMLAKMGHVRISAQVHLWKQQVPDWEELLPAGSGIIKNGSSRDLRMLLSDSKRSSKSLRSIRGAKKDKIERKNITSFYGDNFTVESITSKLSIVVPTGEIPPQQHDERGVRAVALYDYHASTGSEISLCEFDSLNVLENVENCIDGWIRCDNNGKVGIVPISYIKITSAPPKSPVDAASAAKVISEASMASLTDMKFVRAVQDHTATAPGGLSFKSGAKIQVFDDESDETLRIMMGKFAGKTGIFPASAVTMASNLDDTEYESENAKLVKSLYNYEAQQEDELSLEEGDIIEVLDENLDGEEEQNWLKGKNAVNGKVGLFPKAYVIPY